MEYSTLLISAAPPAALANLHWTRAMPALVWLSGFIVEILVVTFGVAETKLKANAHGGDFEADRDDR
jgi:hypothetical protein